VSDRARIEQIVSLGRELGFVRAGVAGCAPSRFGSELDAWLARGAHGQMEWMARTAEIRKDLQQRWPWAKSALVGAVNYLTEPRDRSQISGIARHIARYARGSDYHELIKSRLRAWHSAIEQALGHSIQAAFLVDTSAVLERELALRAGLGWIGKNSCLIGPQGNSWTFLGVVLTDLELEVRDAGWLDRCGSCQACLDACPTAAITEPYFVDASRCISYLTIEHKGPIAAALAEQIGDWMFGCDVCQEVCPWNRRAATAGEPELALRDAWRQLELADLLELSEDQFRAQFRGTAMLRPKRHGMIRNALIASAATDDPALRSKAAELIDDPDEGVREAARWLTQR
jgi:epoxyqueuosine reductase